MNFIQTLRAIAKDDRRNYAEDGQRILSRNAVLLRRGCPAYAAVLCFYTVMTFAFGGTRPLRHMYMSFDVLHLILCLLVYGSQARLFTNLRRTRALIGMFEISILGFFVLEGVYTDVAQPALYLPIAILLVLLLFVHPLPYAFLLSILYPLVFAILSFQYKSWAVFRNDLYIAIATFIASVIGSVLIAQMRNQEAAALRELDHFSKTDALTGILNKSALDTICNDMLARRDYDFVFIIMDMDRFKEINDTFGHDVGDEVLRGVGAVLRDGFRDGDVVGRFGGDEFIVIMRDCDDLLAATERVKRVIGQIAALRFSEPALSVQCSAGICARRADDTLRSVLKRADLALYSAKDKGKGQYEVSA